MKTKIIIFIFCWLVLMSVVLLGAWNPYAFVIIMGSVLISIVAAIVTDIITSE